MNASAIFFGSANGSAEVLQKVMDRCRQERMDVHEGPADVEGCDLRSNLPETPAVVFLPALRDDCLGVKLGQIARDAASPRVVCLFAESMPSAEYLCLAFREGIDDVVVLSSAQDKIDLQVARAARLLQRRTEAAPAGADAGATEAQVQALRRREAKWQERLLALASTADRMATGELNLGREAPPALIVSASRSQAQSAAQVAASLGFDVQQATTAAEALAVAAKRPPRVVLADGTLPDMDVAALSKALRKALGGNPVVVVAWSSSPDLEDRLLVPGSGIDDFAPKSTTGEGRGRLVAALLGALR